MRTFFTVLKNNYLRTAPRIVLVLVTTAVTIATMLFALYMTGVQQVKGRVALIAPDGAALAVHSKFLDIDVVSQRPPHAALVQQRYDAFATATGDGRYLIETLRSDDYRELIESLLENPDAAAAAGGTERGVGVNIIGFMMMFLLMTSFANLFAFAEDKEQGQLRRIAASPSSFGWYLAAHCVYCLSLLIPEYLFLVILKLFGWDIGFTLLQYAGLMAVLALLGISFALLLNTLIHKPDNASMLGNSIAVLTSVLAGSFYSLSKNNAVLDAIVKLLPQKAVLDFAQGLQNGAAASHAGSLLYAVGFSLVLFAVSLMMLRRMYVKN